MTDRFDAIAAEIVALFDPSDEVSECGWACHFHPTYGWVPEADCPVHDAPDAGSTFPTRASATEAGK